MENQYHCEHCASKQDALKVTCIAKSPAHLIITLNRFGYDVTKKCRSKILHEVKCCRLLKIPVPEEEESTKGTCIDLYLPTLTLHSLGLCTLCRCCAQWYLSRAWSLVRSRCFLHLSSYVYARHSDKVSFTEKEKEDEFSTWFLFNDSNVSLSSFEVCLRTTVAKLDRSFLRLHQNFHLTWHIYCFTSGRTIITGKNRAIYQMSWYER